MPDINVKIEEPEAIRVQVIAGEPLKFEIGEEQPINLELIMIPTGGITSKPPSGKYTVTNIYHNPTTGKLVVVYKES